MSTYRIEWPCGEATETEAWEPTECPICALDRVTAERDEARKERDAALDEVARLRGEAEAPAVAGGRGLVWVDDGCGWHLSQSGRDWWTTAPYSAWRDGYATTGDALGRVTRCANCPNACRQIATWARADGHTVPPHPLGWDVGVSDG